MDLENVLEATSDVDQGSESDSIPDAFQLDENFPRNLSSCLALNLAYQDIINEEIQNIQHLIEENKQRQEALEKQMKVDDSRPDALLRTRLFLTCFAIPYFKDANSFPPPLNEDAKKNNETVLLDQFTLQPPLWTSSDRKRLQNAVEENLIDRYISKLDHRIDFFKTKLKENVLKPVERRQIENDIQTLQAKITKIEKASSLTESEQEEVTVDWLKISASAFQGKRDADNCRLMWTNYQNPKVNKKRWKKEEDEKLKELVSSVDIVCWDTVAKDLATERTAFQCIERYFSSLKPQAMTGPWSTYEELFLRTIINTCKIGQFIPWYQVAFYIEIRSPTQILIKYNRSLNPKINQGTWSSHEKKMLLAAVKYFGYSWTIVSSFIQGRTSFQCREKYLYGLRESLRFGCWSVEEDKRLLQLVDKYGDANWKDITKHFKSRTRHQVRARYYVIKKYRQKHSNTNENINDLLPVSLNKDSCSKDNEKLRRDLNYKIKSYTKKSDHNKEAEEDESGIINTSKDCNFHSLFVMMKTLRSDLAKRRVGGRKQLDNENRIINAKLEEFISPYYLHKVRKGNRPSNFHMLCQLDDGLQQMFSSEDPSRHPLPLCAPHLSTLVGFRAMLISRSWLLHQTPTYSAQTTAIKNAIEGPSSVASDQPSQSSDNSESGFSEDRLEHIKKQFNVLESHFQSLFLWPAILAETMPDFSCQRKYVANRPKIQYKGKKCKKPWVKQRHKEKREALGIPDPDLATSKPKGATRKRKQFPEKSRESKRLRTKD